MSTKSKLGTSLRNSVSAEKKSIEAKKIEISDNNKAEKKVAAKPAVATATKPATKQTTQKESLAVSVKPDMVITNLKSAKSGNRITNNSSMQNIIPLVEFSKLNPALLSNINGAKQVIEKFTDISHNVTKLYLENIHNLNDNLNQYFKELIEVNNPANFYDVNLAFFAKLRIRQQEILAKNMQVFGLVS